MKRPRAVPLEKQLKPIVDRAEIHGIVKQVDAEKHTITVTTADGPTEEFTVTEQTQFIGRTHRESSEGGAEKPAESKHGSLAWLARLHQGTAIVVAVAEEGGKKTVKEVRLEPRNRSGAKGTGRDAGGEQSTPQKKSTDREGK